MTFPTNNLPTQSKYWGREVEKKITNLESSLKSSEINNTTRDSQLSVTAGQALTAANNATAASAAASAAAAQAQTAADDAAAAAALAQTAADNAQDAIDGLGSLDEATSTFKINASNITVGTLNADLITAGTLSADRIGGGVINGVGNITSGGTIYATVNLGAGGNLGLNGSIFMGGLIDCDGSVTGGSFSTSGDSTFNGRITSTGTYGATTTSTANLFVASNGNFARSTSSRRYKADIQSIDYGMTALELQPRTWVDINEYKENGQSAEGLERIPGFIAEELDELGLTELVQYNEEGQPDAVYYDRMLVAVIPVIKQQQQLIEQLTARIEALESR
jgi:hypothetical protein